MRDSLGGVDTGVSSGDAAQAGAGMFRLISQLVGLGLLLIGCYYGLSIVSDVLGFIRNPENLEAPAEKMTQVLKLDNVSLPAVDKPLSLGRSPGMICLILWYICVSWIVLKVVSVGGQLMLAATSERREFYAATREMMVAVRREKEMAESKN